MATKFWCKELLMIKPDPAPYLLAARRPRETRLLASLGHPLYYTNPARFEIDELSGKSLGQQAFELQFSVNSSAISQGTTYLIEAPGLLMCKAQDSTLYFKFGWDTTWYKVPSNCITTGWNTIILSSDGVYIRILVNSYSSILIDPTPKYIPWIQPVLTSNTSYGVVTSSSNRSTSVAQAEWHALDGKLPVASDQYTYFGWYVGVPQWWNWNLPYDIRISKIGIYNRATTGTTNYTKTIQFFTNESRTQQLTGLLILPDNSTEKIEYTLPSPITTNNIYAYMTDTYGGTSGYGGIGELEITAEVLTAEQYPQLSVGQILVQTDWTKIRNVRAVLL